MKFLTLLSTVLLISIANAFAPTSRATSKVPVVLKAHDNDETAILSRRDAMFQGAATTLSLASLVVIASPEAAVADIYDDQERERKAKKKQDAEGARKLVPGILIGGTLLSVPFFLPNLIRLAKKFVSLGDSDGYN